jgi:hypothetical protein
VIHSLVFLSQTSFNARHPLSSPTLVGLSR